MNKKEKHLGFVGRSLHEIIKYLVKHKKVEILVTSAGGVEEAISWGKVKVNAPSVKIHCDATAGNVIASEVLRILPYHYFFVIYFYTIMFAKLHLPVWDM